MPSVVSPGTRSVASPCPTSISVLVWSENNKNADSGSQVEVKP